MYPRLGGIENIDGLVLYVPMMLVSVVAMNTLIFWLLGREGHGPLRLIPIQLAVSIGGFGGAKLYSLLFRGRIGTLEQELEGGWRYPGALVGMLAAVWVARRLLPRALSVAGYLAAWAPALAIGSGVGRLGCLLHGCCSGALSHLPWAIQYPYGSIPWYAHRAAGTLAPGDMLSASVHPFPIYLMLMEFSLGAYLLWLRPRTRFESQVVLQFLAIHGLAKGFLEIFRDPFSWLHVAVVPIGLTALAMLWLKDKGAKNVSKVEAVSVS